MNKVHKIVLSAAGAATLMATGVMSASAATHHTATACPSSRSNGMCIYYNS